MTFAPTLLAVVVAGIAATALWRLPGGYSNDIIPHAQLVAAIALTAHVVSGLYYATSVGTAGFGSY